MRRAGRWTMAGAAALLGGLSALVGPAVPASPPAGMGDCPVFPADSFWHADVRSLPVHARSGAWLASMGGTSRRLHPDFGDSGSAQPYGIPYKVVDGGHQKVAVTFDYDDESDPGPYPFGPDIPVEGGSDRHAEMLDRDACVLSELFAAEWNGGSPTAGSGAQWNLRSNAMRPANWTSADAAGLAIFPGLLRRDEVLSGRIDHPIRMTAQRTDRSYVWPARHHAGAAADPNLPPMGAWFRLKADYPTAGLHPHTQVILEAFKTHGLLLADNGSNWYFTGSADTGWESRVLDELKAIQAGAFEAVDASSLMADRDSGAVRGASSSPTVPPVSVAPAPTVPAPTTTARPRPVPTTTTVPPPAAPPTTEAPSTTTTSDPVLSLPTTIPTDDGLAASDDEAVDATASPRVRPAPAPSDRAPLVAALAAAVVAAAAAAVAWLLLRRRRADPEPESAPVP
jgi:hypothetical protein